MAKLLYDGQVIAAVMTNHSMSVDDMLALNEIDVNEIDENGDLKWDYELFTMDWAD